MKWVYSGIGEKVDKPEICSRYVNAENRELSWAGVEIKGTKLLISVREDTASGHDTHGTTL